MNIPFLISPELWKTSRSGARAGRGFRYQDAVTAWLASMAWRGDATWTSLIPEGIDDLALYGQGLEIRVQIKSKHDPQSTFTQKEVAQYLAKIISNLPSDWRVNERYGVALVLERPIEGIAPTGWFSSLGNNYSQSIKDFFSLLRTAVGDTENEITELILSRIHLIIEPGPIERGCEILTHSLLPKAGARLVIQQLREKAGVAADHNYLASAEAPNTLNRSDVQARIDSVLGIIDLNGYADLTAGLVEFVDFDFPMPDQRFYAGMNVTPGHIGAGLVFSRPEPMTEILSGLESKRFVLVAGPSGAGKSALAWLSAHHTRHIVRWYRVRELQTNDVAKLSHLAKILEASPSHPIGFVVDDVGRQETTGWDALVRQIENQSGVLAIGTVREEDIFLLSSAARTPTIRPTLDEILAHRIWAALQATDSTCFRYWQEPYDLSKGLLLEYVHLLTAGQRLEETIREQVRRRLAEDRGDELMILRTVSFATAQGAMIDPARLRSALDLQEIPFTKALQRLVAEHAVRIRVDGTLAGLHEIRSSYLDSAIQEILGDTRDTAIETAVATLIPNTFSAFLTRVLRKWPEQEKNILAALAKRLLQDEINNWTYIFHGLALATADRVAEKWLKISRSHGIEDRFSTLAFQFALSGSDLGEDSVFAIITAAQKEFAQIQIPDLRAGLIRCIPNGLQIPILEAEKLNVLAASLISLIGCEPLPHINIQPGYELENSPLELVLPLLSTLREVDVSHVRIFIDQMGGSEKLCDRLYDEISWISRPVIETYEGIISITGYVYFIDETIQSDLNKEVAELCESMASIAPDATLITSDVLLPDGTPLKFGEYIGYRKNIQRNLMPPNVKIALNRAQIRSVHRLISSPTETERTTALATATVQLGDKLREAGDFYCRNESPANKWKLFLQITSWISNYIQPPAIDETILGPLERGQLSDPDKPHNFVTGVMQLMKDLTDTRSNKKTILLAVHAAELAHDADLLLDPSFWRMTHEPPLNTLMQMRETLWDIRAVLGEVAEDPDRRRLLASRFSTSSRRHAILSRAAIEARERAEDSLARRREEICMGMNERGLHVQVFSRPSAKDRGYKWPDVEFAVILKANSFFDWLETESVFTEVVSALDDGRQITYSAEVQGFLFPTGISYLLSLIPSLEFANEWHADLPYTPIKDEDLDLVTETYDLLTKMSMIAARKSKEFNPKEMDFFEKLAQHFGDNIQRIIQKIEATPDELLQEAAAMLANTFERVRSELGEEDSDNNFATDLIKSTLGSNGNFHHQIVAMRILLMERAISIQSLSDL